MTDDSNTILCCCSGTTVGQIQSLIAEGTVDIDRISRITGALSGCGGCEFDLKDLLKKQVRQKTESQHELLR